MKKMLYCGTLSCSIELKKSYHEIQMAMWRYLYKFTPWQNDMKPNIILKACCIYLQEKITITFVLPGFGKWI